MSFNKSKIFFWFFIGLVSFTCLFSIYSFKPIIDGDGITYVQAMNVLRGGVVPSDFVPNRILTTFFGLESIILFSKIFGSVEAGWLILNIIFYFILNIVFYKLILNIFKSDRTAFLASTFLALNYAMIFFGLDYWMDIGGWTFYILSLYFTLKYVQTEKRKCLLYSSVFVGVGVLFKEYAFLALIPMMIILAYENWFNLAKMFKKSIAPVLISLVPIIAVYFFVFEKFRYTYADWLSMSNNYYIYNFRVIEYVKSFGSLYNVLAVLVLGGLYYFFRNRDTIVPEKKIQVLIVSIVVSALPVFIWPAITQRILFITVPAMLLIASFLFKKQENHWWLFLLVLVIYAVFNFNMSYILLNFNLPF
ncbi:MAG: glycosyltransferase family 39 protein [Parcubacteria group bacterium]|nr:glycosyltransferase family 39 protein [Parcubacteria group bacterium]